MSNQISLTIPNDDPIALRAFGNALEEMAVAHGAESRKSVAALTVNIDGTEAAQAVRGVLEEFTAEPADDDNDDDTAEPLTPAQKIKREMERQGIVPAATSDTLDADGLPWDARIHSGNQERNSDNTWRVRRRPKDLTPEQWAEQVAQVRYELSALMAIPVADPVEQPEPTSDDESPAAVFGASEPVEVPPVAVEVPPAPPIADPVPPAPAPLPPVVAADPVPPAPAPLPTATDGVPATLAELMTWLTKYAPSDKEVYAEHIARVNSVVARHGLVALAQLQKRLDLIPQVYADLVKEFGV